MMDKKAMKGKKLHPNLVDYIKLTSAGKNCIAIGYGPKTNEIVAIQRAE